MVTKSSLLGHFALACILVHGVSGCCLPDKWEGIIGEIGGVARRSFFKAPKLITGAITYSYDATNKTIAAVKDYEGHSFRTVADFNEHKAYVITNSSCKYYKLQQPFKKACTDNATYSGSFNIGHGGDSMNVNSWFLKMDELVVTFSTTPTGCVPVSESIFGKHGKDYIVMTIGYINITTGIRDPAIFSHPASCQPGKQTIYDHLESLGSDMGLSYLMKKAMQ